MQSLGPLRLTKRLGKSIICWFLEHQTKKLINKHSLKLVAVVGSVGKTSTKLAIAKTLSASSDVIYQEGNYNDRLTVPLVLFNQDVPSLFNIIAWAKIYIANNKIISGNYPYKYAVLELGTDRPGEIAKFAYLKPDITVVTAVAEEHLEFFKTLDNVAKEELAVFKYSRAVLVNRDDVSDRYLSGFNFKTYGLSRGADYSAKVSRDNDLNGSELEVSTPRGNLKVKAEVLGSQGNKLIVVAAATASLLGLSLDEIYKGLKNVRSFSGRMNILRGINNSTIIDDSYNASPASTKAGLDVLYASKAKKRIAVLGSMNELGDYSAEAHRSIGNYCRSDKLALVVTIGSDAGKYLAPLAVKSGCQVKSFKNSNEAGEYLKKQITDGTVILVKGSQNRVFAEEAIKPLLKNKNDQNLLVRQSKAWLAQKARQSST